MENGLEGFGLRKRKHIKRCQHCGSKELDYFESAKDNEYWPGNKARGPLLYCSQCSWVFMIEVI